MTSFIIKAQATRTVPELWKEDRECAFCQIIYRTAPAYRVYEDNHIIAFLGELNPFLGRTEGHSKPSTLQIYYHSALGTRLSYLKSTVREFLNFPKNMEPL